MSTRVCFSHPPAPPDGPGELDEENQTGPDLSRREYETERVRRPWRPYKNAHACRGGITHEALNGSDGAIRTFGCFSPKEDMVLPRGGVYASFDFENSASR